YWVRRSHLEEKGFAMNTDARVCVQTRFDDQMIAQIERYRRSLPRIPPMTAAIRALVSEGLKAIESEAGK
ncbi:hypothetical protein WB350_24925, partial [Escherichia coli]|uniref:hypothetical protein n=1 Tax=Escherichia coli TaxID=562 RepID=UPI0021490182